MLLISKFEYKLALTKCKDLLYNSKRLFFNEPMKCFYPFLADSLLLAKCYVREDKFSQAEEILTQGWTIFNKYVTSENYEITNAVLEKQGDGELNDVNKYITTTMDNENTVRLFHQATISKERERIRSNLLIIKELKRRTSMLATFASLFYNIGQLKKAEEKEQDQPEAAHG